MKKPAEKVEPLLISIKGAAERLGISTVTVARLIKEKQLPSVRILRRVLIPAAALDALVNVGIP